MKKIIKWILILLLIGFIVIQFFRIDKTVPEYDKSGDFIAMNNTNEKGSTILKNACYDCHSYETKYPWYAEIAPVSWTLGHHIEEGREHVNFSIWNSYSDEDKEEIIEESIEEVEKGKMPDEGYVSMHDEAKLSEDDKQILFNYLKSALTSVPSIEHESHVTDVDDEDSVDD